jgi:Putative addiction module component
MSATYHIRINTVHAAAVIEDLRKKGDVEVVPEEEAFDVPQWQKDEVRKRMAKYKDNPELLIDEDAFFAMLNED